VKASVDYKAQASMTELLVVGFVIVLAIALIAFFYLKVISPDLEYSLLAQSSSDAQDIALYINHYSMVNQGSMKKYFREPVDLYLNNQKVWIKFNEGGRETETPKFDFLGRIKEDVEFSDVECIEIQKEMGERLAIKTC